MNLSLDVKTLWSTPREYFLLDMLLDTLLECFVIVFCTVFFIITPKFGLVRTMVRRLHRLNMLLCIMCALFIIARVYFQKTNNEIMEHWLTYIINYNLFFICVADAFTIIAAIVATILTAGNPSKETKTYTIWVFFLFLGFIFSGCIVGSTIDFIPSQLNKFNERSLVYIGGALFVLAAAIGALAYANYSQDALKLKWNTFAHNYVQLRYQFNNIVSMTTQAGICWLLKGFSVCSMTLFHQEHHFYHSCFLILLTCVLTVSFLCQYESRLYLLLLFGLDKNQSVRRFFRIQRDNRYLSSDEVQSQAFDSLSEQWEARYKSTHPFDVEMPAVEEGLTTKQRFQKGKEVLNVISQMLEKKRVSPVTHAELFKVEGGNKPTLTIAKAD